LVIFKSTNIISIIPTLLQQNNADNSQQTQQTQQTQQELTHLQHLYDTLKQSYSKLKTHYITTNTKYTDLKVRHQTTLDNNKALLDKLNKTTDTLQSTALKYNQAKIKSTNIISTLKKQITHLHQLNDRYDNYIEDMYDVINDNDATIKRLTNEINKFKNGFNNITTSKLTKQAYDTLQSKYQSIEDSQYSIKCPITQEIIIEPVIAFDGQTYEKQAIQEWLNNSDKSPINGSTLHSTLLIPNHFARILIDEVLN
jgi:chromosome segregation ATPase